MKFDELDAVLFDMDGTLYRDRHALPGVADVMTRLVGAGVRAVCVTNNSAHTGAQLSARLADMGIPMRAESIFTAAHAMVAIIHEIGEAAGRRPNVFNFAGDALPVELGDSAGLVEGRDAACDVVAVATFSRENRKPFDFERAVTGLNLLRSGATLLVGSADRAFPVKDEHGHLFDFGSGSLGAMFAYAADLSPDRVRYAGKPEPHFFELLGERYGIDIHRCLMVGDNLESDISGAKAFGMATALVLTGVSLPADIDRLGIVPDLVCEDLPALADALSLP